MKETTEKSKGIFSNFRNAFKFKKADDKVSNKKAPGLKMAAPASASNNKLVEE